MLCCISEVLSQPHPVQGNTPNLPCGGLGGWVTLGRGEDEGKGDLCVLHQLIDHHVEK